MEAALYIKHEERKLAAILHTPEREEGDQSLRPLVVICHGFVGSKTGVDRLFVKAARELVRDGHFVLRFDYAGCGESEGEYGQGGLDHLLAQTESVLEYAFGLAGVDPKRVILLGHSLGGAVALLAAARDPRVRHLVMWAPVAHPFQDIVRIVGEEEYHHSHSVPYVDYAGYALTNRFFRSLASLKPLEEARQFSGDVLLLHGTHDDMIPASYSFLYHNVFKLRREGRQEKEIILGADHTFSGISAFNQLLFTTRKWLTESLQRQAESGAVADRAGDADQPPRRLGCL